VIGDVADGVGVRGRLKQRQQLQCSTGGIVPHFLSLSPIAD